MAKAAGGIPLPPWAYVPGKAPRHPEDWFDAIKSSVRPGMTPADLQGSEAFVTGLHYLAEGYFWECHEVLEAVWMETAEGSAERDMVQALIQLANARLKIRMERPGAARRLCDMVEAHLSRLPEGEAILNIEASWVRAQVEAVRELLKRR